MSTVSDSRAGASTNVTRWWWVRHAPVTHLDGIIYGDSDPDANVTEAQRFDRVSRRLPHPAHWIVTNLKRTRQTAQAIVDAGYPMPRFEVDPDLREQGFGEWHGRTHVEHDATRRDRFIGVWNCDPHELPPGGERFVDLMARTHAAVERWTRRVGPGDVVCVAHGGTIRAALALALDLGPAGALAFGIDNVSITRIEYVHDAPDNGVRWRVREVNG